jgi:hypothetical protein
MTHFVLLFYSRWSGSSAIIWGPKETGRLYKVDREALTTRSCLPGAGPGNLQAYHTKKVI